MVSKKAPDPPEPVQWPQDAAASTGADLAAPIVSLLKQAKLLPEDETKSALNAAILGSSESATVIKSGALTLTKNWAALLGISGTAAASTPLVSKTWWTDLDANGQFGFLLVCGLIASACVLGISYLLASDVRGRAAATTAQITQRASIVNEFLRTSATLQNREWEGDAVLKFLTAAVPLDGSVQAKIGGEWKPILGFERRHAQTGAQYPGDWKPLVELAEFRIKPPDQGTQPAPEKGMPSKDAGQGVGPGEQAVGLMSALVEMLTDPSDSSRRPERRDDAPDVPSDGGSGEQTS